MCISKKGELTIKSWELKGEPFITQYQYTNSPYFSLYISYSADKESFV